MQVSNGGGVQGRWRGDSRELYYLALDGTLMAVNIGPGAVPQIGKPAALLKTGFVPTYNLDHYAVASNGQRFVVRVPLAGAQSFLNVIVNWPALLKR